MGLPQNGRRASALKSLALLLVVAHAALDLVDHLLQLLERHLGP